MAGNQVHTYFHTSLWFHRILWNSIIQNLRPSTLFLKFCTKEILRRNNEPLYIQYCLIVRYKNIHWLSPRYIMFKGIFEWSYGSTIVTKIIAISGPWRESILTSINMYKVNFINSVNVFFYRNPLKYHCRCHRWDIFCWETPAKILSTVSSVWFY